jgi:tetratricopeptide (TPR) repeat protein
MPTINKSVLLKLLAFVLAFATVLVGVHTVQADRIPEALKRQADRAVEIGKLDLAVRYLRQYLEFSPDDIEIQIQLADLLRKRNSNVRGQLEIIFLYDRILRLDPDRHSVRKDALAICLKLGRFSDAIIHAEVLLKEFPADGVLWHQLGAAQAGLNQLTEARLSYEKAIELTPLDIMGYQRLAQLIWRNMNDPEGARAVLDRLVKAVPDNPESFLIRARFETFMLDEAGSVRGDVKRAEGDLYRVFELDPENADATLLLADLLQRERNVVAAHALLRDAVVLYPKDLRLIRSLSWLELVRGNAPAAIGILEDGLKAVPDAFDLLVPLADLLVQQGDISRTYEILRQLENRKAPPLQCKYLKARVAMRDARWLEANELLQTLRGEAAHLPGLDIQLNQLLAVCAGKLADTQEEESAYQRVIQADSKNVQARVGLGNLYLRLGKFDEAIHELETAAQSPYAAASVISEWVRTKTRRLRATGASPDDWRKLEQGLIAASGAFGPVSSEPAILQAELGIAMGKAPEAIQQLRKETARRPGDTRLWAVLAETTAEVNGTAAGLSILDEGHAAAGDTADIRLARARLYAGEPGRVRSLASLAERTESWPEAEQLSLFYGLVEVHNRLGDQVGVVANLRRIAGRRPGDAGIWVRLHERALRIGDTKSAAEAMSALVKLEGESGVSVALCAAASARPTDAPQTTDRLIAAFGANPPRADACLALARLYRLAGNDPEESRLIERAFILEPTRFEAARAWLLQLCSIGADDRAQALATRLATDPRWMGEPFRQLIDSTIPTLATPIAAKLLTWCRPLVERDPGGLGWLGETAALNRVFDPIPLLEEATKRPTATADDWLRLSLHRGPAVLTAARAKLSISAYLSAAAVFRETPEGKNFDPGTLDNSEKRLYAQVRLALHLSQNKPEQATKVLEEFLAGKNLPQTDEAWGKRNLAMLYAVGGTPEDRKRAMELIKDVSDAGTTPEDLRSMASALATLASYLEGSDRIAVLTRAASALDGAYKAGKSPKDLFNLSQLYRSAGIRDQSRVCLQTLLNSDQNNIYYLVAALEEHLEDRNFEAGEAFAKKLLSNHAGEFRALAAVARFDCQAGRPFEALTLVERYAQSANPGAGDHLTRSARVAELLDELTRMPNIRGTPAGRAMVDAAVERFAALIPTHPEAIVGLVGALSADNRASEGFARIERLGSFITSRLRAAAGLAAVRGGTVSEKQAATALVWIDECLAEEPESSTLKLNKAEFFALRRELPMAIAQYEEILAKESRNVIALNNLAWLLSADSRTAERALELVARAIREVGLTGDLLDTRARVLITLKSFNEAERDLGDAIRLQSTPLRWFHLAVSRLGQSPPKAEDAAKAFKEAKRRGLEPRGIHPVDLPTFKILEAQDNALTQK